jgi:hypothetical protein
MAKSIKINDHYEITIGRLVLFIIVTFFQFLGIWCTNDWVITPSLFFLLANAFLVLGKQKIEEDKLTDEDIKKFVDGIKELVEDGKEPIEIIEVIKDV